jgi:hypothetical protein
MSDPCIRKITTFDNEEIYLTVGDTFVIVTDPGENYPVKSKARKMAEDICGVISSAMEDRAEKSLILAAECNKADHD